MFSRGFSPSMLPSWRSVLTCDFAAQPSQWINADGPVVIGGVTWTKVNSASHAANRFGVVNGVGLLMNGIYGGMPSGNAPSTPMLRLPVVSLYPTLAPETPVRLTFEVCGAITPTGNEARIFGGFAVTGPWRRKGSWTGRCWEGSSGIPNKTFAESWDGTIGGSASGVLPISSDPYGFCTQPIYLPLRAFRLTFPCGLGLGSTTDIGSWGASMRSLGTEILWSGIATASGVAQDPVLGEVSSRVIEVGGIGGNDLLAIPYMTRLVVEAWY